MKTRTKTLLIALFSLLSVHPLFSQTDYWICAYYTGYARAPYSQRMDYKEIDYSAVTHIMHFSLWPNADGTLNRFINGIDDTARHIRPDSVVQWVHQKGKKILITVGGAGSDVNFRAATEDNGRSVFVHNIISFMLDSAAASGGYEGIDIDWEKLETTQDSTNFIKLITDLRNSLDSLGSNKLLTATTIWWPAVFGLVHQKLDRINLMTYDYAAPHDANWRTWHNSALYNDGRTFTGGKPYPSVELSVNQFKAIVPVGKLGVGTDFYGYVWRGATDTGQAVFPCNSMTNWRDTSYFRIMDTIYPSSAYRWDDIAKVPYLRKDTSSINCTPQFISYENQRSILEKTNYAWSQNLGGIILWELAGGYRHLNPEGTRDSLLRTVKATYQATINASISPNATAYNNQRKLYRESSGKLQEVFESDQEIFYRSSTDGGSSWQVTRLLSSGSAGNTAPCITMAGSTLIVIWQQTNGSNYNIMKTRSTDGGSTWIERGNLHTNFSSSGTGPLPTVSGYTSGLVFAAYRTGSNISYVKSTNSGNSWSSPASVSFTTSAYNMPSSGINSTYWSTDQVNIAYATNTPSNSPQIHCTYLEGSTWGTVFNLTSIIPSSYVQHENPCLAVSTQANNKYLHVAWDAADGYGGGNVVILHRRGGFRNFSNEYSAIRYQTNTKPSITALNDANAWAVFQTQSGYGVWKAQYTYYSGGWYWYAQSWIADGYNPQISVGSSSAKYLYTSTHSSPYQITLATETLAKPAEVPMFYSRQLNFIDKVTGACVTFELTPPRGGWGDSNVVKIDFLPPSDDNTPYTMVSLSNVGTTQPFSLDEIGERLKLDYTVSGVHPYEILDSAKASLQFQLISQGTGKVLASYRGEPLAGIPNARRMPARLQIDATSFAGRQQGEKYILRPVFAGVRSDSNIIMSLGHVYQGDTALLNSKSPLSASNLTPRVAKLLQNYPNPFNPETQVSYELPDDARVVLKVYNMLGQEVRTLDDEMQAAGQKIVTFDAQSLPSGVYFYRLQAGSFTDVKKMLLIR